MPRWWMIYKTVTGRARSLTTVKGRMRPDESEADLGVLADNPHNLGQIWDDRTRAMIPRPAPPPFIDRLTDLRGRPGMTALWASLNPSQQDTLRNAFIFILGRARFRRSDKPDSI